MGTGGEEASKSPMSFGVTQLDISLCLAASFLHLQPIWIPPALPEKLPTADLPGNTTANVQVTSAHVALAMMNGKRAQTLESLKIHEKREPRCQVALGAPLSVFIQPPPPPPPPPSMHREHLTLRALFQTLDLKQNVGYGAQPLSRINKIFFS